MGRQQYLTRLGLGRSAFQEAIEEQHTTVEIAQNGHEAPNPDDHADGGYIQQYDSKGRPVNPATEARNAEMRRAPNSVLALVGVVESREHSQRESEVDLRRAKDERQALLASEDEAGSILEIVLTLVPPVLPWSIDSFIMRYQIGLYDAGQPFAYCLRTFWTPALAGGLQGAYCALLAGGAASTLHAVVRAASDLAVDVIAHPIRGAMLRQGWRRKTLRRLGLVLQCWEVAVLRCVDVLLLPVHYWSMAQQLGLAPAFPLLPPARSLLPWHPSSFHAFGWEPLVNLRFVGVLSSPAALLLFYILAVDFRSNLDLPIASKATEVQYTGANDTDLLVDRQALPRQPLAWLLYQTYYVRAILLRWCGWELVRLQRSTPELGYENFVTFSSGANGPQIATTHRSTTLAYIPTEYVASSIEELVFRLVTLPLDNILLRAVAVSYIASPLPKTLQAAAIAPWLYAPFRSSVPVRPHSLSPSRYTVAQLDAYASKIGLGTALWTAAEIVVFGGVYALVRLQGVRHFGWARSSSMRKSELPPRPANTASSPPEIR